MSRNIILTLFFTLYFSTQKSICQENNQLKNFDSRLIEFYGENYLLELSKKSPNQIEYLSYFLDNSYYITDVPVGKTDQIIDITEVEINPKYLLNNDRPKLDFIDLKNLNVLVYNFKRNRHSRTLYKLGNTGKMIVFYSQEEFIKTFNEYIKSKI